ncbi:MAG: putative pre6S rRNA nuclease [Sphingomonadales bacterium]|jgi:putative Holliday junction resolvase|nr:putative pre6S rRNA nuclease [Sphingomonadales bacterium]MEA3049521.1 putative pre6S rRNA nuclease [Sphingomonadales bacterium]
MLPTQRRRGIGMDPSLRWGDGIMITASVSEFRDALPEGGRLLGLDVGTRTIGVALCDSGWTIATPAELIRRGKFTADLAKLRTLATAQQATGAVIGLPLSLDGSDSPRTQSVRAFARNLAPLGLPILLWDERWSTQAVTRTLLDADASRARRADLVDKMAAAYILQGAIDALTMA